MIFEPISYLNLLKIHIFFAKNRVRLKPKQNITPEVVNKKLIKRKIGAAFVSSIVARKFKYVPLGIVANKKVMSVLVFKGQNKKDPASATSNLLANILNISGETVIGDNALKRYEDRADIIDLASLWHKKTGLPFTFGLLAIRSNFVFFKKMATKFPKKIFIPHSKILQEAKKRDINHNLAKEYLKLIHHKVGVKERRALMLFWRKARLHGK